MASLLHFLLSFLLFLTYNSFISAQILSLTKDFSTLQYVTQIAHPSSQTPTKLVLDLSAPFLWMNCDHVKSFNVIPSCSIQCLKAKPGQHGCNFGQNQGSSCDLSVQNGLLVKTGQLVEDLISLPSLSKLGMVSQANNFLFACGDSDLLNGLASGVKGVLGLGRTRIALQSQLAFNSDIPKKFSTCLSSSNNGALLFGNVDSYSVSQPEILKSLTYTPLVKHPDENSGNSQSYYIKVKSVELNGKKLALGKEGIGFTKISTVVPYTTLESSIYETFVKAYSIAASGMNLIRVDSVSPFGLCFSSKGIEKSALGPFVPIIDFVLQSEMVKWRFLGWNTMVEVNDEVMCLGVLDGGLNAKDSIVIGGLQLEDILVEFDLSSSMLGFSLPLSTRHSSCSNFVVDSTYRVQSL